MFEKLEKVIERVNEAQHIDEVQKPLIIEKIKEWQKENEAINDVAVKFENWWLELEPIFAEMGLI
jgi:hypothetical protein